MFHRLFRRHHRAWFANWMLRRVARKLRLDPQQREQLQALHTTLQATRAEVAARRHHSHAEVGQLLSGDRLDRDAARRLLEAPRQAMAGHTAAVVEACADLYDGLRPEQRLRLRALWQHLQRCHHRAHA